MSTFTFRNDDDRRVIKEVIEDKCYTQWNIVKLTGTILDCGAHIGAFTKLCLLEGVNKVIAVEPHPDNFNLLQQNCKDRRVTFINKAISTKPLKLTCSERSDLHKLGDEGLEVATISLDELLTEPIDVLKMDIEGGEYDALYTAKNLDKVKQITMEYHNGGTAMAHLLIFLEKQGFTLKWIGGQEWGLMYLQR
ncbi:MAG: FkbM family methyltransferase [Patescibacteria group bacterium]|jgi:FkbM family methyltransferase